MRKVVKTTFITDICDACRFFGQQFGSVYDAVFIHQRRKGFSSDFFQIATKGGRGHVDQFGNFVQADVVLKMICDVFENTIHTVVVLLVDFNSKILHV